MKADARLRMEVYQEGQRAFSSGALCPYTDWRAGTWRKGFQSASEHHTALSAPTTPIEPTLEDRVEALEEIVAQLMGTGQ